MVAFLTHEYDALLKNKLCLSLKQKRAGEGGGKNGGGGI